MQIKLLLKELFRSQNSNPENKEEAKMFNGILLNRAWILYSIKMIYLLISFTFGDPYWSKEFEELDQESLKFNEKVVKSMG